MRERIEAHLARYSVGEFLRVKGDLYRVAEVREAEGRVEIVLRTFSRPDHASTPPAKPEEFIDGRHWADIIGCDARAGVGEIARALDRRSLQLQAECARAIFDLANAGAAALKSREPGA